MATGNLIANALIPNFILIQLGIGASEAEACADAIDNDIYIPNGFNFSNTSVIWLNDDGTGIPAAGFYYDGAIIREWNGVNTLGGATSCPVAEPIELGYNLDGNTSCDALPSPYFINTPDFATATKVTTDSDLLNNAIAGFYGDGLIRREWDGSSFISTLNCAVISIPLGFDAASCNLACVAPTNNLYLSPGLFSYDRAKLWTTPAADVPAPAGYYSDSTQGETCRFWDGTEFTSESPCVVVEAIDLGFDAGLCTTACGAVVGPYFMTQGPFSNPGAKLWTDPAATAAATAGFYADSTDTNNCREWNGTDLISNTPC